MACVLRLVSFLACAVGGLASRVKMHETQRLPWKKGAVLGTLLGRTLASRAIVDSGSPDIDVEFENTLNADAYGRLETTLGKLLFVYGMGDAATVARLVEDLRRDKRSHGTLIEELESSFSESYFKTPGLEPWLDIVQDNCYEEFFVPLNDGGQVILIGRFPAQVRRGPDDVKTLERMLWIMQRTNSLKDIFLASLAQSHTPDELALNTNAEVLLMIEPNLGTLHDFLIDQSPGFDQLVQLFIQVFEAVRTLFALQVPHKSDIQVEKIIVKGIIDNPDTLKLVLNPAMLVREMTSRPADVYLEDVQQLGTLLRFMFDRTWPASLKEKVDAVLAFGRALECGAIPESVVVNALTTTLLSDQADSEELVLWRIRFLREALAAERSRGERLEDGRDPFGITRTLGV